MTSTSWEREKALFLDALAQPADTREQWVFTHTPDEEALREAVLSLLTAHDDADEFLETPAASLMSDGLTDPASDVLTVQRTGPYRLLREIGRGGMGTVYLATRDDGEYRHQVAIKLVKRGMDTDVILARFRHERQILAGLDHPNIARLLDGGTTDTGLPYFVMEYVAGCSVREYAELHGLTIDQRLTLFHTICGAVDHAHRNLVVHRDLKSGNILVTTDGTPKLLDFGIAKLLTPGVDEGVTASSTLMALTPEYASPEQLRGERVTTATDVYSLGVLLYELLAGQRPFPSTGRRVEDLAQLVRDTDPPRPSDAARASGHRDAPQLRGDLDTIVMMAMHKDVARRYASVAQLSEDIARYQQGLAVRAHGDSFGYRATKFVRRHRPILAVATLLFVALVGGLAASLWQANRADIERARAERRFAEVRSLATGFLFDVHDAIRTLPGATPARAMLVQRGLLALDGLAREAQGDTALQRDLAIAYQRIGDVQGNSYGANLGDTDAALVSYRKAVELLESLGAARATNPATRQALVESYRGLAAMLNITGELPEAVQYLEHALALQRPLVAADPSPARRQLLANLLQELGDVRGGAGVSNVGDTKGAMAAYGEALAIRETLLRERPTDIDVRAGLATLQLVQGSLAITLNDSKGAGTVRRGVAMLETIVAEHPDDAVRRNELLSGYARLRVPLVNAGDYAAAITIDRKVLGAMQGMANDDPQNTLLQRNLSVSYNNLARDLRANGQATQALPQHRSALVIAERLWHADTSSMEHLQDVAFTEDVFAEALADAQVWPEALAMYARAIASKQRLKRAEPANPWHADDLGFLYAGLGAALVATNALPASSSAYDKAVPLAESAVTRQEGAPKARGVLALVYAGVARLHLARASCGEAMTWHAKAERHWSELATMQALTAADIATRADVARAMSQCKGP
ncbi:MAG TPA: serine/threonine-protein kinase [Gemmatimonas sp.]|uniref:serine/threonine-protein kinase n=1 Tax=Gemmatimonas sp. TaxID=1962908 RepID=UPI002ED80CEB